MTPAEVTALRRVYGEIARGYSEVTWDGKPVYIAHLTTFDQTEIDILQDDALAYAVKRGVKTEAERLKWLEAKKIWTPRNEMDLAKQRAYVDNLKTTRSKAALKVQIQAMDKQVNDAQAELDKLAGTRARAIGLTAERVAEQRVQLEYIRATFYRDIDLRDRVFTQEAMHALDEADSDDLLMVYIGVVSRFTLDNIKKVALQPFFSNQFYLCGEHLRDFFGTPIVDLTIYQANLLSYGKYYRDVFSHHQIPKEIAMDPDKIESHITYTTNAKNVAKKAEELNAGMVGIVGGQSEDFAAMGVEDGSKQMQGAFQKGHKSGLSAAKDFGYVTK